VGFIMVNKIIGEEGHIEIKKLQDGYFELFCKDYLDYYGAGVKLSRDKLEALYIIIKNELES
jgi:hypothetical protein